MLELLRNAYNKCKEYILGLSKKSQIYKINILNYCLLFSFFLFYASYFFFINGIINPAVKIVFHGSIIADKTNVYENSIIESIWLLFTKGSYFNMAMLLFFSIIIPFLKLLMVSDNFYSFIVLYKMNKKREEEKRRRRRRIRAREYYNAKYNKNRYKMNKYNRNKNINDIYKDDIYYSENIFKNDEINYINTINENEEFILKKFKILNFISRFQFVDVFISLFIVSSLNLYLLEARMLNGAYYFLNYCMLSTISSFLLFSFTSLKIHIFKNGNIKISACLNESNLEVTTSGPLSTKDLVEEEGHAQINNLIINDKNMTSGVVNDFSGNGNNVELTDDLKSGEPQNRDDIQTEETKKEKMNTRTHNDEDNTKKKNIKDKKKANGDDKVIQKCIDNERKKKQNGMIQSVNDGDKNSNFNNNNNNNINGDSNNNNINGDSNNNNINGDSNNNNYHNNYHNNYRNNYHNNYRNNNCRNNILEQNKCDKNVLCYNNIYNTMKDNDTYIYLKKNKFNSLLKSNCIKTNFNMIKIGYVIFLFVLLCLCIYLITGVECSLFGIYIYLSYFNFNIEGILIDYMDMLNILKLKIKKGYIYPFFVMLPFIFPVIIAMCFFLSVFFLNMYYESFSKLYKKISELKNEFINSSENDNVNERILVSETSNHLCLNESNDKVSNTSDDFLSRNNSNISSSKSEMINSNFVFNKLLNFYFSFAVFFSYLGSAFLHISLGEIICIALLTFYQIVKHTNNLNITILLKSEKIKFCKFLLFILYGLLCFSINLYVNQWEEYITKLKRLKRRILLFEKNKFSEIVDLNTQKGDGDHFDETQIFSIFFSFLIKKNEGSKMRDNDMNSDSEDSIYDAYEQQIQLHHGDNMVNGMLMMRRISMQNLEDDETQVEYINREIHTQGDLHVRRTNQGILRFNMRRGKKGSNENMGVHHESGNVDDANGMNNVDDTNNMNNVDGTNNMNNVDGTNNMNNMDGRNNMNNINSVDNMNNLNNNDGEEEEECVNDVLNYDNNNYAINEDAEEYIKNTSGERAVIICSEKRIYEKNGNGDIITRNYKNEERYIYLKKWIPFKAMILSKLEKRKRNRKEEYNTPRVLILIHSFLFILIVFIFLMVFFKKEPIFRFNMPSVNKRLNNFFKSTSFHEIIPNSVGKCKTKKYIAKEPCFNVGHIYHEEKTFYHATLLFLQGLRSVKIMNMNFYYEKGIYYLSLDGYFKHIIGPLFLKLCLGTNFCPISTYAFLVGSKPTFSVNVAVQCNNKKPPYYMTDIIVKDLKITKIEIVKHSDVIDNVDIKLDDVQDRVQEKVNAMLEAKKKIIVWKNQKYHLEGFLNYLISKNALSGFSCEPINY
ncbi:hypothetical protein PFAG_00296 [Plasmodium falciparum Santa Lucia]|uniref:Uncharacterized protein n=1 Tax=Plasmodium falciparum Santa Lucia TaxID=478859 RepID=W7GCX1_PLAFA|nr:hypothetical protein PFAG_00296 [Plasmodium falciparum Santa Lucia]